MKYGGWDMCWTMNVAIKWQKGGMRSCVNSCYGKIESANVTNSIKCETTNATDSIKCLTLRFELACAKSLLTQIAEPLPLYNLQTCRMTNRRELILAKIGKQIIEGDQL